MTMNAPRITTRDIAAACGVHNATVSRALTGSPLVNPATRQKILETAERLGYRPDPVLGALASYRRSKAAVHYLGTIAWLWNGQSQIPVVEKRLRYHLEELRPKAERQGFLLEEIEFDAENPERTQRILLARGIHSILVPPQVRANRSIAMDFSEFAAVRIGHSLREPHLHMIGPQQFSNMRLLVRSLLERGHQRIGFCLTVPHDNRTLNQHSAAFRQEQLDMPKEQRIPLLMPEELDQKQFLTWTKKYKPDVIIGLIHPLRDWLEGQKFACPVFWCDDLHYAEESNFGVDENWGIIFENAVYLLDAMLRRGERGVPEHPKQILIEGTLHLPEQTAIS